MSEERGLSILTPDAPSNGLVTPGKFATLRDLARVCGFDEVLAIWSDTLDAPLVISPSAQSGDFRLARPKRKLAFAEAGRELYLANLRAASLAEQLIWHANYPKGRHLMPLLAPSLYVEDKGEYFYPCISQGHEDTEEIITLGARRVADGLTTHDWILVMPLSPRL